MSGLLARDSSMWHAFSSPFASPFEDTVRQKAGLTNLPVICASSSGFDPTNSKEPD